MRLRLQIRHARRVLAAAALAILAACGAREKQDYVERPVEQLYNSGVDALAAERYATAARAFDEVERQHPYSAWATKAQLMAAYAHYQNNKYDDAIVAVDRFIQLNPSNRDVGYAYYLKTVVDRYQTTSHVPEALHRLVESYSALGLAAEAERTAAVLGHNYPGSEWYLDSHALVTGGPMPGENKPGLTRRILRGLNPF